MPILHRLNRRATGEAVLRFTRQEDRESSATRNHLFRDALHVYLGSAIDDTRAVPPDDIDESPFAVLLDGFAFERVSGFEMNDERGGLASHLLPLGDACTGTASNLNSPSDSWNG